MKWWANARSVDPERLQLAQKQFDFYADELKEENPYSKDNDAGRHRKGAPLPGAVRRHRARLRVHAGRSRQDNPPINFNRQFPGSAADRGGNARSARRIFQGRLGFMKDAIQHADRYFSGEQWVLGDQGSANIDRAKLEQDLRARYNADFVKEWRAYIKSALGGALRRPGGRFARS